MEFEGILKLLAVSFQRGDTVVDNVYLCLGVGNTFANSCDIIVEQCLDVQCRAPSWALPSCSSVTGDSWLYSTRMLTEPV